MNGNEERVRMGIDGLDEMLSGGLIPGSFAAIVGTYGTGKTTFALQFIWEGLVRGKPPSTSALRRVRRRSSSTCR